MVVLARFVYAAASNASWSYGEFAVGATVFAFKSDVPVRAAPGVNAPARFTLAPGAGPLTVLAKSAATFKASDGLRDHWYRVRVGNDREGWVWGGALAKVALSADLDNDNAPERVLVNVSGTNAKNNQRVAEARVLRGGAMVARATFAPIEVAENDKFGYSVMADVTGGHGLAGVDKIVRVKFRYGACDYPNGDVLLFWSGGTLRPALTATSSAGETGGSSFALVFPDDKNGRPNQVTLIETAIVTSEDHKRVVKKSVTRRVFHWDGARLTQRGG